MSATAMSWYFRRLHAALCIIVTLYACATSILVGALSALSATAKTYNYFAIGSNMCSETMTELRKLSPLASTAGVLTKHDLRFNLPGTPLVEPSWASVEPSNDNSNVHGVLYKVTEEDFVSMCNSEGVPFAYTLHRCSVIPYRGDGKDAGERAASDKSNKGVKAYTLRAARKKYRQPSSDIPPSRSYMNVLLRGAREYKLDASYLVKLEKIPIGNTLAGNGTAELMLNSAVAMNERHQRRLSR